MESLLGPDAVRQIRQLIAEHLGNGRPPPIHGSRRRHTNTDPILLGKTDEAIAKGATGTVSMYIGASGTETDSGDDYECKNRFADVESGAWVAFALIGDQWYLIAAECEVA